MATVASENWGHLLGKPVEEAAEELGKKGVQVQKLPTGSFVTMDYRPDRVRVYFDKNGNVASVPRRG